jgi:hypothetical protein
MHQLKDLLDPAGILNPHKVLPERPPVDDFLDQFPGWDPDPEHRRRRTEAGV